jgi:hypothetical protein
MSILGDLLPVVVLVLLAVAVPKVLARYLPEGIGWLFGNGVIAAIILWAISYVYFAVAYAMQFDALNRLLSAEPLGTVAHFAWLGLLAGMIWVPVLVLALASLPKRWVEVVW